MLVFRHVVPVIHPTSFKKGNIMDKPQKDDLFFLINVGRDTQTIEKIDEVNYDASGYFLYKTDQLGTYGKLLAISELMPNPDKANAIKWVLYK